MFKKTNLQKITIFILCFCLFFAFNGKVVQAYEFGDITVTVFNKILEWISKVLISLGDGVLHLIIRSVGTNVTIDKIVFNDVEKLSIDYWTKSEDTGVIKAVMAPTVNNWYSVFFKIAMIVYMMTLVVVGISILLSGMAQKKAKYHELLLDWVIGLAILFMFPYAMKYIVIVNDAIVKTFAYEADYGKYRETSNGDLAEKSLGEAIQWYGRDDFIGHMGADEEHDMMLLTRAAANGVIYEASTSKSSLEGGIEELTNREKTTSDPTLAIVYLILIGQLIAIVILYYKRAFMIAFLITIFPLVGMTYVIDKMGDRKTQTFGTWFKEYVVNVVVQLFHAIVYILITGPAIKLYLEERGATFVFMLIAVLFLFEGEKILRSIFGIKSSAKTIGDLAMTGAAAWGVVKGTTSLIKRDKNDIGSKQDKEDSSAAKSRIQEKTKMQEDNEKAAKEAMDKGTSEKGSYEGKDEEPEGVREPVYDGEKARDTVLGQAMKRRLKRGVLSSTANFTFGAVGATLAATQQMATGQAGLDKTLIAAAGGKTLGKELGKPVTWAINKGEQAAHGGVLAHQIGAGRMDKKLGISNLGNSVGSVPIGVLSDGTIPSVEAIQALISSGEIDKYDIDVQKVYREALRRYAYAAATGGKAKAEVAYWKYMKEQTLRNS